MIDHVLGRPSSKSRRLQILAVLSFWSFYLYRGSKHGPPGAQTLSRLLSTRLTTWQTIVLTMLHLYAARNFSALVGLASPEPMANMYDPTYFRATWFLTALDAGFWTAMRIQRPKWLRDIASIVFSVFYLVSAERADEKVRKVRGMLTVEHLRVSWNKGTTPYLSFFQGLLRPRFTRWPPRQVRIPRPRSSDYKESVVGWLYYDGPLADLEHHNKVILDIPGGGFVAMDPRCNDDKLFCWAAKSGLPILSLDYRKAPEYPYPYALNECFDVYTTLVQTKGRCIGMSGKEVPRIIVTGDSAGGNLAVAMTLMILENDTPHFRRFTGRGHLPAPDGLVCFYPALDMNIGNWMTDEQMSLIRDRKMRKTNKSIVRRKSRQYNDLVGTPHHSDDEDDAPPSKGTTSATVESEASDENATKSHPEYSHTGPRTLSGPAAHGDGSASLHVEPMKTRLATSSMISYFNDRVLTPEMMRAMIILYIGPHNRPDFSSDYLLSPVLAPEALLAKFPKTYFMTGERDPLVDDTVIFSGRLARAKEAAARHRASPTALGDFSEELRDLGTAEVMLIPGTSHGFMQFPALYLPAWKHFQRCAEWFEQLYTHADAVRARSVRRRRPLPVPLYPGAGYGGARPQTAESSGDEDRPLEMSMLSRGRSRSTAGTPVSDAQREEDNSSKPRGQHKANGKKKGGMRMNKSLVKLASEEDLLSRRMHGLTSGLTGKGDDY
ncbi:Alpha/Beta hydrolase protein [Emericellopsis atlantica]|uniref:Alpha/Beta hydrolase protein n=1 Tax=Emericellopsis atlantica TaxID=2614577 RepID=A0A9P7ZR27_9HYPO|nr:Alpha/Beta hydrolase protein [Emericellopsis atlantica]KAG9256247.1 Alpha/Beta hydrolase protein [Emericellopsis atlantica]